MPVDRTRFEIRTPARRLAQCCRIPKWPEQRSSLSETSAHQSTNCNYNSRWAVAYTLKLYLIGLRLNSTKAWQKTCDGRSMSDQDKSSQTRWDVRDGEFDWFTQIAISRLIQHVRLNVWNRCYGRTLNLCIYSLKLGVQKFTRFGVVAKLSAWDKMVLRLDITTTLFPSSPLCLIMLD